MTSLKSAAYERVVQARAQQLGVSLAEAETVHVSKPLYLAAAERDAARRGTTAKAVLLEDLRRLEESSYPTPDCITPDDLEDLIEALDNKNLKIEAVLGPDGQKLMNSIWSRQLNHLATCDPCRTLLVASQPSQEFAAKFDKFVAELNSSVTVGA